MMFSRISLICCSVVFLLNCFTEGFILPSPSSSFSVSRNSLAKQENRQGLQNPLSVANVGRGADSMMMMGDSPSKKKVIVLGGDGFCGWPTSLYLSEQGHDIIIVDNLSRRNIDIELGCSSLTPIESPEVRVKTWNQLNGSDMRFIN